ncbi:hypothetical protein AKJ41_00875 [candidate division MSBL1 archaeon SCGC-AAA259O05]|uniref:Uncharacterized protein n=1 Tax=candidate division MSBL1 archaeon SCGC-AAA259O05 TaxID=1698271 RepID=A0A133V5B4_9EURY|nr:hypothetical protein AKJ41_00875 [candidate division MSBL1 archaeon SCGC-AAA259O05]
MDTGISEKQVAGAVAFGIFLIWVASLIGIFGDSSTANDALLTLKNTGIALVSEGLIAGGVTDGNKSDKVRVAMVVMGSIVLWILISTAAMQTALQVF